MRKSTENKIYILDNDIGCDAENGGILCKTCGEGLNSKGAVGLSWSVSEKLNEIRQMIEHKINAAREFIKYVRIINANLSLLIKCI